MGNIISNTNEEIRTDTQLGREIYNIFHNQTIKNNNKVQYFTDPNKNNDIKINQLKACCIGAVGTNNETNRTLGIPLPYLKPEIKNIDTDCKMGENCLETKNVGYKVILNSATDRPNICGDGMDNTATTDKARNCDALVVDSCAKELYDQGCLVLTNNRTSSGVRRAKWNTQNPECSRIANGNPIIYTGSPLCSCANSMFGPNLNMKPSQSLQQNPEKDKNPYGLTNSDYNINFDTGNQNTVYSLNIFNRETNEQAPGFIDSRCMREKVLSRNSAYNLVDDRGQRSMTICINSFNLTDSNIGKAYLENNTFENNCGNVGGGSKRPTITDATDECLVSNWSDWGSCSKTCGTGQKTRTRTITQRGTSTCPPLEESQTCNTQACPPVNCVVSDWSGWSQCDKTCGGGQQTRNRTVVTPSANGGTVCPVLTESQSCNTQACPPNNPPVNCVVSDWSGWSQCDKTCGGGQQTRNRTVVTPSANGGTVCPVLTESQSCNSQACPPNNPPLDLGTIQSEQQTQQNQLQLLEQERLRLLEQQQRATYATELAKLEQERLAKQQLEAKIKDEQIAIARKAQEEASDDKQIIYPETSDNKKYLIIGGSILGGVFIIVVLILLLSGSNKTKSSDEDE